jgi:uncharacterized membrane protein YhhN
MRYALLIFLLLAVLTSVEIHADIHENHAVLYATKPALLSLLIVWYLSSGVVFKSVIYRFVFIGLCASLAGDVFLMIRGVDLFIPGLLSFLTAHIFYILSFRKTILEGQKKQKISWTWFLGFVVFLSIFLTFLLPYLLSDAEKSILIAPVVIYAMIISVMGYFAATRKEYTSNRSYLAILIGSLLFILSDSILAIDKFAFNIEWPALWVMTTYVAAQFLIVFGTIAHAVDFNE